jgi:hypothetical protein
LTTEGLGGPSVTSLSLRALDASAAVADAAEEHEHEQDDEQDPNPGRHVSSLAVGSTTP